MGPSGAGWTWPLLLARLQRVAASRGAGTVDERCLAVLEPVLLAAASTSGRGTLVSALRLEELSHCCLLVGGGSAPAGGLARALAALAAAAAAFDGLSEALATTVCRHLPAGALTRYGGRPARFKS